MMSLLKNICCGVILFLTFPAFAFPETHPDFRGLPVISMEVEGQKVWVKQPGPQKVGLKGCLKKALTQLIPIAVLRPTYYCLSRANLQNEAKRIDDLQARGIPVPQVLDLASEWIVLSDLGPTLHKLIKAADLPQKQSLMYRSTQALAELHAKGGYHGRGSLRDMTLTSSGEIGFIDFEENPKGSLPLKQARDLLMHLYSLSTYTDNPQVIAECLQIYRKHGPALPLEAAILMFNIANRFIQFLNLVPLGRDGVRLLKAQHLIEKGLEIK